MKIANSVKVKRVQPKQVNYMSRALRRWYEERKKTIGGTVTGLEMVLRIVVDNE